MYTLRHLLSDCSGKMTRTTCAADKKKETLEEVWVAFNAWIESRYNEGKGVNAAPFCKISWETVTISRNTRKLRPIFLLHETYAKTYGLHYKKRITAPVIATLEDINFTKIAIKFSKNLNKDTVFCGLRDILHKIGEIASTGAQMSIEMTIGKIVAKNRAVHMLFDPKHFPKNLENIATASMTSTPPSILGDLADFDLTLAECNQLDDDDLMNGGEFDDDEPLAVTPRQPPTPRPLNRLVKKADSPRKDKQPLTKLELPSVTPPTLSQLRSPRPASRNGQGYVSVDVPSRDYTTMALSPPQLRTHPAFKEPSFDFSFKDIMKKELEKNGSSASLDESRNSTVAEAAYERHMARLEKDVELEAQHAMDIHRHHVKDIDEMASEKRKKRANAEKLQDAIKEQMAHATRTRERQKREQSGTDPSENTFLSHSQHSRLGFNSPESLKKNQNNMHQYLEAQINEKDKQRRDARTKALAEDKQFLAKLERDIQQDRDYVRSEQNRQRQILTQAWEKDHSIKTATHQSRKLMNERIKTAIATSPIRQSAVQQLEDMGKDDFSVGYDVRASKSSGGAK
ncbi:Aste57867_12821 [Aphanomyces stellatus]|uniref:Aste57867_12821 protein n=1 Tax=Aphanomyces stellatus TaxID=120398 RepID=A0A485KXC9_9STRA|nr:hypothetical protein As57867_012773 [Aphanomyces stellatus]VFT89668.1 Aste57867_12821 [Aphanomyces stellatus]